MGTRGLYGFRYKKKYYMIFNPYDSYFHGLGMKLLKEVREMVKNNQFDEWLQLFIGLEFIYECDNIETNIKNISFSNVLHSEFVCIEQHCLDKIPYSFVDAEFFYILDFDKKRFMVKESGHRLLKYDLFNGDLNKVYYDDTYGDSDSDSDSE
jgi:hypothetical protein